MYRLATKRTEKTNIRRALIEYGVTFCYSVTS